MDTKSCALPGLLASLLVGLVLLLSGVQLGTAERTGPATTLFSAFADTQHIHLTPGWNFVGARVTPDATDFELLFEDLAEVPLVSDGDGGMYYPSSSLNTTGAWDTQRGYFVYAEGSETLVLEGAPLSSETIFSLEAGWNLVPFVLQDPMDAEEAFVGISDQLLMAKDDEGKTFIPESGINTIGALRPGGAYQLFVSEAIELSYTGFAPPQEFVYDHECLDSPDSHRLHDFQESYGTLTLGSLDINVEADSILIAQNTTLINSTIDEVGVAGGGTICLPKGKYFTAPTGNMTPKGAATIQIHHDNITLWGAGRNDNNNGTAIYTRGKHIVVDGKVVRGRGLKIYGPPGAGEPRENITLRDFELNGQAGYTGNFGWPADPVTGDGWDTTHKGIVVGENQAIGSVRIENIAVRTYKAPLIYYGGSRLGTLIVDNIISENTNGSTFNAAGDSVVVTNSEFGLSRFWVEIGMKHEGHYGRYANNTFKNSRKSGAFSFSAGSPFDHEYVVENNTFENCNFGESPTGPMFGFHGATSGSILIQNNDLIYCGGINFTSTPAADDKTNRDVQFSNNDMLMRGGSAFSFLTPTENILINNNTMTEEGDTRPIAASWGGFSKENTIVENNTFTGGRTPEQTHPMVDDHALQPLFRDNIYVDTWTRNQQSRYGIGTDASPVRPLFEKTYIVLGENSSDFKMTTTNHPDGQPTTVVFERNFYVFIPANHATYQLNSDRTVTGGDTLDLEFDATLGKWIEVP